MTKLGTLALLGSLLISACTLNHAERRAATGGMLGAGAGAAGGYLMGYDPVTTGLLGGAGGALLGAITTPDRREVRHHHHYHDRKHGHRHHRHHGRGRGHHDD